MVLAARCALGAGLWGGLAGCQSTPGENVLVVPPMPEVGTAAPELTIDQFVRGPDGRSADWSSLRGKVTVIEFWATWCAPCRAAIPHLNRLVERFRGEPVVFVSITDEPRDKAEEFLGRNAMDGWVGCDPDRSVFLSYRVGGIPRTFVVDGAGVIRDITYPLDLGEGLIQSLLDEQKARVAQGQ